MDVLFQNTYVRNKDLAKEIYSFYYFRRPVRIFCHIALLLCIFLRVYSIIFFGWDTIDYFVLLYSFLLILQIPLYFHQVNTMVKRDLELSGDEITVTTNVTEDYIENINSIGAKTQLRYENIKKCNETKNLILLFSKANMIYIFRKDSFVHGTADEFKAFIRNKGIKVR